MKRLLYPVFVSACLGLVSCTPYRLPSFSSQQWHVDAHSGNAISTGGLEFGFGSEWMITDTTLIQTSEQMERYSKLPSYLAKGIAEFSEIEVDSIYFYNPHRGLLFASYRQVKPLKPTSEIYLNDEGSVYSKEYAHLFGALNTYIEDDGWENGPANTVYVNVRYTPRAKRLVLLHRIPYRGNNLAIFHICATNARKGKWWEGYPPGTFWNIDLGDAANIECIAAFLHSSRSEAVANLRLGMDNYDRSTTKSK